MDSFKDLVNKSLSRSATKSKERPTAFFDPNDGSKSLQKKNQSKRPSVSLVANSTTENASFDEDPMPSEADVQRQLEELMNNLGFEKAQRDQIEKLPIKQKWKMVQSNKQRVKMEGGDSPDNFISKMKSQSANKTLLVGLKISLRNKPISFVITFIENGGLIELLYILDQTCKKETRKKEDWEMLREILQCLKALMNNKHGLKAVLNHDSALDVIIQAFELSGASEKDKLADKGLILELMTVMCFVESPRGHSKVLKAWDHLKELKKEDSRFRTLVNNLGTFSFQAEDKEVIDFLVTSLMFINAVIHAASDLDFRIHIRNEFYAVEFAHILEKLKGVNTEYSQKQIQVFENAMTEDYDELLEFFDQSKIDFQDPQQVFQKLYQSVVGTASEKPFKSIFQHLTLIRQQPETKKSYWQLLNGLMAQIVLDKKGFQPDFSTKYKVSIEELIELLMSKEKLKQILDDIKEAKTKMETAIRDKDKLDLEWRENFENTKSQLEMDLAKAKLMGGSGAVTNISEEDLNKLFGNVGTENSAMKKILLQLKNGEIKQEDAMKIIEENKIGLESPASLPDISTILSQKGAESIPGGLPPPPPPPPPFELGGEGGGGGPPPPPPPPPDFGGPPPPPPPPGGMGGPPPPPPPPGMGGPPPPPPPGGGPPPPPGAPSGPAANKFISLVKMKQFHWDKVPPTNVTKTVWEDSKMDEANYKKTIDWKDFETLFGAKEAKDPKKQDSAPKEVLISVVDSKKAYNCSLMLGLLKMTNTEIKNAILSIDKDHVLADNTLVQMVGFIASSEELASLAPFKDDPTKLAAADQYMLALSEIPRLEQRLQAMIYQRSFKEKIDGVRPGIDSVTKASRNLKSSKPFHKVLEVILLLGNYMNGTGRNGNAAGFKLASLNKLIDTKAANNKSHLLHYISSIIETKFPDALRFLEDLADIEQASKISFATMNADMGELRGGLKKIENEVEQMKKNKKGVDQFVEEFQPFVVDCRIEFDEVEKRFKRMEEAYQETLAFYGDDPKTPPEEFFAMVQTFIGLFQLSLKENQDRIELQIKEQKKQQAIEEREEKKKQREIRSIGLGDLAAVGGDEKAVLDDMLQSLKSGEAYEQKEKRKKRVRRKNEEADDEGDSMEALLQMAQKEM